MPEDLSPSEFEELRKELWQTGNTRDLELGFEIDFEFTDYPFFFLLMAAEQIDRGEFVGALMSLEGLELASQRADLCQYVFLSEIAMSLRHIAIRSFLPKDTRDFRVWDAFGHGVLRYFGSNDYGKAKCIILKSELATLKLNREPTFEEYPRSCLVR